MLTIKNRPERKEDETSPSPEDGGALGKEGKLKASTSTAVETIAKPETPTTPKSSHKSESFKRKLEADNIVVTTRCHLSFHLLLVFNGSKVFFHVLCMRWVWGFMEIRGKEFFVISFELTTKKTNAKKKYNREKVGKLSGIKKENTGKIGQHFDKYCLKIAVK